MSSDDKENSHPSPPQFVLTPDRFQDDFRIAAQFGEVLRTRESLFVGKDVSVITGGQILKPSGRISALLAVPEGYFSELGLEVGKEPDFIRFLLSGQLVSIKSKLAQSAIGSIFPNYKQGTPFSEIPVEKENGTNQVPVLIESFNPNIALEFPHGELPFLRFYLPSGRLYGADLFQEALKLSDDCQQIGLMNGDGEETPLADIKKLNPTDFVFDQKSDKRFVAVALPIVRHGRFTQTKLISAEDLTKHLSREELDNLLGLSWQEAVEGETEELREYQISETVLVCFNGFNGLIISGAETLPSKASFFHSGSVVIDSGFSGAIRTEIVVENWVGSPRVFPKRIGVFLHR